jgi:hypothetical protein
VLSYTHKYIYLYIMHTHTHTHTPAEYLFGGGDRIQLLGLEQLSDEYIPEHGAAHVSEDLCVCVCVCA